MNKDKEYGSFAEKVWDVLSNTDVSTHTETIKSSGKRPDVTYLPWHKAWLFVKREFPATFYQHREDLIHKADSVEVEVTVHIENHGPQIEGTPQVVSSSARLAVMDGKFNAILMPDATQINKARQRCLVKALAFAGLGLNLWSESPLPVGSFSDPINAKQVAILEQLIEKTKVNQDTFLEWLGVDTLVDIPKELYPKAKLQLEAKLK